MSNNNGYLVEILGRCEHEKTGKEKRLFVPFLFKSESDCEMYSGEDFDSLYEEFDEWLQKHGREGWNAIDVLEQYGPLKEAIDPVIVTGYA